jgi:ribosomal protein S18 acetylase RimI-like enzyme
MFFVRVAKAADAPKIARIHVETWLVAYRGQMSDALLDAQNVERREAFWRGRLGQPSGLVFVIESDEIVGFCDLVPSRDKGADPKTVGEIAAIYVLPDYWRQGAGKALGYYVLEKARKRGYKAVTLWVLASNSDAMRFYESQGFARDGDFKIGTAADGSNSHELRYRIKI